MPCFDDFRGIFFFLSDAEYETLHRADSPWSNQLTLDIDHFVLLGEAIDREGSLGGLGLGTGHHRVDMSITRGCIVSLISNSLIVQNRDVFIDI